MALKGNKSGVALKDKDVRQKAYKSYCAHLALGKSQRSWWYDEDGLSCCHLTMEKMIEDKSEFDPKYKMQAICKGLHKWEAICEESAEGSNKNANTASLQMVMRNKYGWDKPEKQQAQQIFTLADIKRAALDGSLTQLIND